MKVRLTTPFCEFIRSFSLNNAPEDLNFIKILSGSQDFLLLEPKQGLTLNQDAMDQLSLQMCPRKTGVGALGLLAPMPDSPQEILFSSPKVNRIPLDAVFAAARWLFDSGIYGLGPLDLKCKDETFSLEPIDSKHFRIRIPAPTWQHQNLPDGIQHTGLQSLEMEGRQYSVFPIESRQDYLVYLHTPEEVSYPEMRVLQKTAEERQRTAIRLTPHSSGEIRLDGWGLLDGITTAACGGMVSRILGVTQAEVLVKMSGNPYFIQILPDRSVEVTTTAAYVFAGQWNRS